MLLIQSQSNDLSTEGVLAWLHYLYPDQPFIRINDDQAVEELHYLLSDEADVLEFNIDGHTFHRRDLPGRWYRRGAFHTGKPKFDTRSFDEFFIGLGFRDYLREEMCALDEEIDRSFGRQFNSINAFGDNGKGKLENIYKAKAAGLKIPQTLITNSAGRLLDFMKLHDKVITKALHGNRLRIALDHVVIFLSSDTSLVHKEALQKLLSGNADPLYAVPSLYQQYIEKKFELRIFFLAGRFFAMAIFSQANEKTRTDYRNYDEERPNRCVPFALTEDIKEKLTEFMRLMNMNCGSVDMICTPKDEYVFLEVNPIGQFQWLDKNCNYFIEREIAIFLQHEKQEKTD